MIVLDEKNIILDCDAQDWEQVIRIAGARLRENGYIDDAYIEAIIEREKEYPTGLPTDDVITALPHANSGAVYKTGVCVVRLAHPVDFRNMGDPEETLPVEMAFVLANASGPDAHLEDLQELMDCFTRVGLLADLKRAQSVAAFQEVFAAREQYPEA